MLQQLLAIILSLFVGVAPVPGEDSGNQSSSLNSLSSLSSSAPADPTTTRPDRPEAPAPVAPVSEDRVLWEDAVVVDPNTVVITFDGGDEMCYSYRAEVTETDKQVTINLFESLDFNPAVVDPFGYARCNDILMFYQLTVTTEDPVFFKTITQDPLPN